MVELQEIIRVILQYYPAVQAIYLYGSFGTEDEWPESDVDIALLLPPELAREIGFLELGEVQFALEDLLGKKVDMVNLRRVPTVLQKEVVMAERRVFTANAYAAAEFEMLTLTYYQKLNEERAEIIADILATGRIIAS